MGVGGVEPEAEWGTGLPVPGATDKKGQIKMSIDSQISWAPLR